MTENLDPVPADTPQPALDPPQTKSGLSPDLFAETEAAAAADAPVQKRPLWLAFLAAAGVALLSGLLWAGIAIATGYYLGILALFIGAATGLTAQMVAGAGIGGFERVLSGIFAAGAIILGNYVIVVHEAKDFFGSSDAPWGSVGYFSGDQISDLVHNFGTYVDGWWGWVWIALAVYAAIRTSGGGRVLGMGSKRS